MRNAEQLGKSQHRESIIVSGDYDPIERVSREQAPFNDAWIGERRQRGWVQHLGFLVLSTFCAAMGAWTCLDTFLALPGSLFMFAIGVLMLAAGLSGIMKVVRDVSPEGLEAKQHKGELRGSR